MNVHDKSQSQVVRDIAPDVLRGFALLGIILVNIEYFAFDSFNGVSEGNWLNGAANSVAGFLVYTFFQAKFYLLFSFLFGYSSNYIIKGDLANRTRWIKRCLVLMGFGVLHFTFLWQGEIVFIYGLFGLILVPFLYKSDLILKKWAQGLYITIAGILGTLSLLSFVEEEPVTENIYGNAFNAVMRSGTYLESISARFELWANSNLGALLFQGCVAFVAFLLGLRLSRSKALSDNVSYLNPKRMMILGYCIGVPIQMVCALVAVKYETGSDISQAQLFSALSVSIVSAPLLTMAYIGTVMKLIQTRPALVSWMRFAGRMSLTVYISQSLLMSLIFGSWGLGLFQQLDLWLVMLIAAGIWLALVIFSTYWLKKFKQGPAEKLLSLLT